MPLLNRRQTLMTAAAASLCSPLSPIAAEAVPMALWTWLESLDDLPTTIQFAKARGFSPLLLHLRRDARKAVAAGDGKAVALLKNAKSAGIALFALAGEAQWAQKNSLPNEISDILAIQQRLGVFSGLHLDIEPHTLPQWRAGGSEREALILGYAGIVRTIRSALDASLPLQAAIHPKACLQVAGGEDLIGRIAPSLSEVAIMAYRPTAAAQLHFASDALARISALGLPWRMGILAPKPDAEPNTTCAPTDFGGCLIDLWHHIRTMKGCRGLAVENARTAQKTLGG